MCSSSTYSVYREILLQLARDSILYHLEQGRPLPVDCKAYPEHLRVHRASFVTLHLQRQLRGCIGTLEAYQPLVVDVANNAQAAAFSDPRFPPLSSAEYPYLDIHISILSPPEPMCFSSEHDLLAQLRPNVDGLILKAGRHRGTFLPSVWESLPNPHDFLLHLKYKAGLPADYWTDEVEVLRYTAESIGDHHEET